MFSKPRSKSHSILNILNTKHITNNYWKLKHFHTLFISYYFSETINSCHREVNSNYKESPVAKDEDYTRNTANM